MDWKSYRKRFLRQSGQPLTDVEIEALWERVERDRESGELARRIGGNMELRIPLDADQQAALEQLVRMYQRQHSDDHINGVEALVRMAVWALSEGVRHPDSRHGQAIEPLLGVQVRSE